MAKAGATGVPVINESQHIDSMSWIALKALDFDAHLADAVLFTSRCTTPRPVGSDRLRLTERAIRMNVC